RSTSENCWRSSPAKRLMLCSLPAGPSPSMDDRGRPRTWICSSMAPRKTSSAPPAPKSANASGLRTLSGYRRVRSAKSVRFGDGSGATSIAHSAAAPHLDDGGGNLIAGHDEGAAQLVLQSCSVLKLPVWTPEIGERFDTLEGAMARLADAPTHTE